MGAADRDRPTVPCPTPGLGVPLLGPRGYVRHTSGSGGGPYIASSRSLAALACRCTRWAERDGSAGARCRE